ncbi:uncharacterized protein LOC131658123 [Vicia villosa]|uniref:uncharacterized protein LOC131658123 n=1 Tax=Vicia villosa TaxID=3911 RepID=UPI00273C6E78|nr:uncharacterized protein LOC131658123 [Vicia villosa]
MTVSQEDIAYEIFSWLPAKTICKFKLTCTSFSKFSEEFPFKTKQSCNLLGMSDTCFLLQHDQISQRYQKRIEFHHLPKQQQFSGVPNNVVTFLSRSACVLASSNGLLLCRTIKDDPIELFICNPITKSYFFIPTPESLRKSHNFSSINLILDCSHSSPDDYLIFLFENTIEWSSPTSYICNIYHGKEGVWRTMENNFVSGGRNMKFDTPVIRNETLYFISDCNDYFTRLSPFYKPYIMSYNCEKGTSTILKLPREAIKGFHAECNMGIFSWGKVTSCNSSICLVKLRKSVFTIWILKDYKSWQKILKVRVNALGLEEKDAHVTGFTVMNGNILVFSTEQKVYSCGLDEETFMMVEEIGSHSCGSNPHFISYSNTLRPCGTNDKIMPC